MTDYSQFGEQAHILAWADRQTQPGSFLDLGCYDGRSYSNTAALADRGWPGICVDAAPDAAIACVERYLDRDDISVVNAAFSVAETPDAVTIHWSPGAMYSAISASKRPELDLVPIEVAKLDLVWLAERVSDLPRPLFCSIDLEGASIEALAWLLEHADPGCICVEANNPPDRAAARELLADWHEVSLWRNNSNLLFERVMVTA